MLSHFRSPIRQRVYAHAQWLRRGSACDFQHGGGDGDADLVEGVELGAQNAYEKIRERMIEIRDRNDLLRVTVVRAGVIVELAGTVDR